MCDRQPNLAEFNDNATHEQVLELVRGLQND